MKQQYMNKKILIPAIIIVAIIVVGIIYFFPRTMIDDNSSMGHNMSDMTRGPADQSHRGYELEVISDTNNVKPGQKTTIAYKIKNDKGVVLKNFDMVHEKIMHFITVRKDLQDFQHLHPTFNEATGEFSVDVTFPENGPYRLFPDFTPGDDNPQKLPVTVYQDINVGNMNSYVAKQARPDAQQTKSYGLYTITSGLSGDAKAQKELTYSVNVSKNGKPVTNLENYLGALGHTVILKEGTLDFIHTHAMTTADSTSSKGHNMMAMQQGEPSTGPKINFSTTFPDPGVYKLFTQFQHEGNVQTADYTVQIN